MQDHFVGSVEEEGTKVVASMEQSHAMVEDAHTMQDDAADSVEEGRKVVASSWQPHAMEEEADNREDIPESVQEEGTKVGASSGQPHASVEEAMSDTAQDDAADSVQEAGMEVVSSSGQAHVIVEEADTMQEYIEEGPTVVASSEQGFGSIECVAKDSAGMSGRSEQFRQLPSIVVSVERECLCQEQPVNSKSLRKSSRIEFFWRPTY